MFRHYHVILTIASKRRSVVICEIIVHLLVKVHNNKMCTVYVFLPGATQPIVGVYFSALYRALASSRTRLLDHTQRRAKVGRTPLNE